MMMKTKDTHENQKQDGMFRAFTIVQYGYSEQWVLILTEGQAGAR